MGGELADVKAKDTNKHYLQESYCEYYTATLSAASTEYDLVHNATAAVSGRGTLVAIGYSVSGTSGNTGLATVSTTIDGGTKKSNATSLSSTGGIFDDSITRTLENVIWMPMGLEFKTSILVGVTSGSPGTTDSYAHAIVRYHV